MVILGMVTLGMVVLGLVVLGMVQVPSYWVKSGERGRVETTMPWCWEGCVEEKGDVTVNEWAMAEKTSKPNMRYPPDH
jgi:hypothetical protein